MFANWLMQPARRVYVGLLFILLIVVAILLFKDSDAAQLAGCNRANQVRKESNLRIAEHIADARNVGRLERTIAHTRQIEAQAWMQLGQTIRTIVPPPTRKLNPGQRTVVTQFGSTIRLLIVTYDHARAADLKLAGQEQSIRFDRLPLTHC